MTTDNTWTRAGEDSLALRFAAHTRTLRGAVRQALVTRALLHHLPAGPGVRVLDVGGGAGVQARQLAYAGHQVTVLDPDPAMLAQAQRALAAEPEEVRGRVRLVQGRGEDAAEVVGADFAAVLCDGVLMYLDDPGPLIQALVQATAPGGLIFVLAKKADALAMRPALEGRWDDALHMLDADPQVDAEVGNLGVPSRGSDLPALIDRFDQLGAHLVTWYGVRIFTDHLRDAEIPPGLAQIVDLEWQAGCRDPYRGVARLFHLVVGKNEQPPGGAR